MIYVLQQPHQREDETTYRMKGMKKKRTEKGGRGGEKMGKGM
jgi:hypothetical protein